MDGVQASSLFRSLVASSQPGREGQIIDMHNLDLLLDPNANSLFDPLDRRVYQDMTRPLSDYYMSSSHNTYIGGNQLYGKSSTHAIERALKGGVRVIELDCMDGTGRYVNDIVVKHRYTPMVPVTLHACLQTIRDHAFDTSPYPVILTMENHCGSHERQRQQASILREVLGSMLYVPPKSGDQPGGHISEVFASPEDLRGKVVLRHKFKVYDLHGNGSSDSSASSSRASSRAPSPLPFSSLNSTPTVSPSPSPSSSPSRMPRTSRLSRPADREAGKSSLNDYHRQAKKQETSPPRSTVQKDPGQPSHRPTTSVNRDHSSVEESHDARIAREKALQIYQSKLAKKSIDNISGIRSSADKYAAIPATIISKLPFGKKGRKSKKAIADDLSELVVICNQKVKVKTLTHAMQSPFALSCSWTEGKLKRVLKSRRKLVKTMTFCRRHLMRVYPGMFRLDSSNFGPQKVWNTGVQMVALNTQTWGKAMALHVAKFEDNGGCGYVLKPKWLLGSDEHVGDTELAPNVIMSVQPVACWVPHQGMRTGGAAGVVRVQKSARVEAEIIQRNQKGSCTAHEEEFAGPDSSGRYPSLMSEDGQTVMTLTEYGAKSNANGSSNGTAPSRPTSTATSSTEAHSARSSAILSSKVGYAGQGEEGLFLEGAIYGADPAGLEYRKQRRSSSQAVFYNSTLLGNQAPRERSRAFVTEETEERDIASTLSTGESIPSMRSSTNNDDEGDMGDIGDRGNDADSSTKKRGHSVNESEASEYAVWRWDEGMKGMEFNIYDKKGPGIELLFCSVVYGDGSRKRRSIGQFSIAVANIRPGLRVVRLRNHQTGEFLQHEACILLCVKFRPMQDDDFIPDHMGQSSSRHQAGTVCLGVGRS